MFSRSRAETLIVWGASDRQRLADRTHFDCGHGMETPGGIELRAQPALEQR